MRDLIIKGLFIMLVPISCVTSNRTNNEESDFYITLGSCFNNDTTSLSINNVAILENEIFSSDFSTGLVMNLGISHVDDELIIKKDTESASISLPIEDSVEVQVMISGKEKYVSSHLLKKGKYLVIDACNDVQINQYKKKPVFE